MDARGQGLGPLGRLCRAWEVDGGLLKVWRAVLWGLKWVA
jgi:hypothetical protein